MANANSTVAALNPPERRSAAETARRERALTSATHQLEAILRMMIFIVHHERDEPHEWPDFDEEMLPEITRALAIRGRDLNAALMGALVDEIRTEDLEDLVFRG